MRTQRRCPGRSLLSRLTDHYMQIIANRAPVGFEAEFQNPRGDTLCYRGILLPFSSDGDTIDFIYGVINWKRASGTAGTWPAAEKPDEQEPEVAYRAEMAPVAVLPANDAFSSLADAPIAIGPGPLLDEPVVELPADDAEVVGLPVMLDAGAGLADRLCVARETAETVKAGEGRTRAALYQALSLAYDFAVAAAGAPHEYAELLEESGVKAQARAPMTPIVKLVFGIDYDKARLTEFSAALSFAQRQSVAAGEFESLLGKQPGGLKALVAAERQSRRPDGAADTKTDAALAALRSVPALSLSHLPTEEEFALVIVRHNDGGGYEAVALIEDQALVARAVRRAA